MFRSLFSLVRDSASRGTLVVAENRSTTSHDPQIRACTEALGWARKALAVAAAQNRQEKAVIEKLSHLIANLERRATLTLGAGNEPLAREAAAAIALLENARNDASEAISGFSEQFGQLRQLVRTTELSLQDFRASHRIDTANGATIKQATNGKATRDTLAEVQTTLARLQSRQNEIDHANNVLNRFDAGSDPNAIVQMMTDAGFGVPAQKKVEDIFERLRAQHEAGRKADQADANAPQPS